MTRTGIKTATFRLVAWFRNEYIGKQGRNIVISLLNIERDHKYYGRQRILPNAAKYVEK
jgi:hypothetical protein